MTKADGFTLLEALVAFAVLALVLTGLYQAVGSGLRLSRGAAETLQAVEVARSLYDGISAAQLSHPGTVTMAVPETPWRWRLTVAPPAATETSALALRRFTIEVLGPDDDAPVLAVESARLVVVR